MVSDDQLVSASKVTKLASKLHLVVSEATLLIRAQERRDDDLLEERNLGVHEARLTLRFLTVHTESLDDVTRHASVKIDEHFGEVFSLFEFCDLLFLLIAGWGAWSILALLNHRGVRCLSSSRCSDVVLLNWFDHFVVVIFCLFSAISVFAG